MPSIPRENGDKTRIVVPHSLGEMDKTRLVVPLPKVKEDKTRLVVPLS